MNDIIINAKKAAKTVAFLDDELRNQVLNAVADRIEAQKSILLGANASDLALMSKDNPLYDRLLLTEDRLSGIASDMRKVAMLPDPLGRTLCDRTLQNGLHLRKVSVPYGVIAVIYEARPNVTFDVFSLCFKSGNSTLLKGGKDADNSNRAAVELIHGVLSSFGISPDILGLMPATHDAAGELLSATGYVDLVIPRGGRRLIDFVRDNAKVPCIETGAGVVNCYFDSSADLDKGIRIIRNAKTRRVSVCNALDCLIIHSSRLKDLPAIAESMPDVTIFADDRAYEALAPALESRVSVITEDIYGTEFMDYKLSVKTVDNIGEALEHIDRYGSGHSESIVTEDTQSAELFRRSVDAACVYVNAPTSFTDGAQFGLGAEIGISTQKLGARGPMGLEEITTYKWLIDGDGQVRE